MSTTAFKTKEKMQVCGFCSDGRHERCPHALVNGNHGIWLCNCAEPNCGGKILSCTRCKKVHDDVTPDTRRCVDRDACKTRLETRRANDSSYQQILEITRRSKMAEAKEKAATREKKVKEADCTCGCGGKTKGGKFLPGHDARYVSQNVAAVLDKSKTEAAARKDVGAASDSLRAKFDKSLALAREKATKKAEAAKAAKAEKAEAKDKSKA